MATSVMDQIRKLDEQRNALLENAKKEAMEKANAAIADLNSLGFNYRLTESGSAASSGNRKGTRQTNPDTVCKICNFKTEPAHDGRRHRGQKDGPKPFTDDELAALHLKKVG